MTGRRKYRQAASAGAEETKEIGPANGPTFSRAADDQLAPAAREMPTRAASSEPGPQRVEAAANDFHWVKLSRYCATSGDTVAAVHARRHQGKWTDGVQTKKAGGSWWINLKAVEKWITEDGQDVNPLTKG